MSPSSGEVNGPRPARLKLHKDSHHIHKPSSSSSSSSFSSSSSITSAAVAGQQRHQPVIIYTHSPKIIHTHARDFMALVQKLTGLSHSDDDEAHAPPPPPSHLDAMHGIAPSLQDDSSSSSENYVARDVHISCTSPPIFEPSPMSPLLPEIPLFVPSSSEFFYPMKPSYRYPGPAIYPPVTTNIGGPMPPPVMNVMNPFHEF